MCRPAGAPTGCRAEILKDIVTVINLIRADYPKMETVLHTTLKFQLDRACFQRGKAIENFSEKNELI